MTGAVLSVGSNVGDRLGYLRSCVRGFGTAVRAVSPVYETAPWGGVAQEPFLNAVLLVDDDSADAAEWLRRGQEQESRAGRTREVPGGEVPGGEVPRGEVHWGPRTLDVDVVLVDAVRSADPVLTLPHPHAHERAFVLVPWLAADPGAVLPGRGRVEHLVGALPAAERDAVRRRDDLVLP